VTPRQLYSAHQERKRAEELLRGADVMALATVDDDLSSCDMAGRIYTDAELSVIRGSNVEARAKITLRRDGGRITVLVSDQTRLEIVSYSYVFPPKGGEVSDPQTDR
jgi:hypothetical protein